ncbi:cytochrome p450 78a7 [Quercus suber]|uniref:Cytochrome p450 78a7 n=1 Tax=Quercus suber TaxID=58331 RepID=A0AAW0KRC7_QUESU
MAFSLGSTPVVVASDPFTAKEILTSPNFADRPIKQSAKSLIFSPSAMLQTARFLTPLRTPAYISPRT